MLPGGVGNQERKCQPARFGQHLLLHGSHAASMDLHSLNTSPLKLHTVVRAFVRTIV